MKVTVVIDISNLVWVFFAILFFIVSVIPFIIFGVFFFWFIQCVSIRFFILYSVTFSNALFPSTCTFTFSIPSLGELVSIFTVFLIVVTLQVLQLEVADIRAELAGESLASFQLVDRMLAENVLGQVPHQGETGLAESTGRDGQGNLLELETGLIDGKLILEFYNVAMLQHVMLLELDAY